MQRLFIVMLLLVPALSLCWSERGADSASSSKGLTTNTCGNNPGPRNPYSNQRFSLAQLTATTSSRVTYDSTVDVYAWGDYNCALFVSGNPTSGEDPASEDTILGIAANSGCLSSLADQASCTLNIVFTPSAVGVRTARSP